MQEQILYYSNAGTLSWWDSWINYSSKAVIVIFVDVKLGTDMSLMHEQQKKKRENSIFI
jgi:hypothetical protein